MLLEAESQASNTIIQNNINIETFNTFRVRCIVSNFAYIRHIEDLRMLICSSIFKNNRFVILGCGSNTLFVNVNFDGLVVKDELRGVEIVSEDEKNVFIRAASGENWNGLVQFCVARGYGGIENLSLIPGTVGAAPVQNIGAYSVQISDALVEVETIDLTTGDENRLTKKECGFAYRKSTFSNKKHVFITAVLLRLTKSPYHTLNTSYGAIRSFLEENPTIASVAKAVSTIRQSKLPDPSVIPNCGSFFKNPCIDYDLLASLRRTYPDLISKPAAMNDKSKALIPAGWLIEKCGWKGKHHRSGVGTFEHNALVIVNDQGSGDGVTILELSRRIQDDVLAGFGVQIFPEITIIT